MVRRAGSNGDDQISLWKGDDMIDIFGVPGARNTAVNHSRAAPMTRRSPAGEDGTGTDHEFEDSHAVRTTAGPTPTVRPAHAMR